MRVGIALAVLSLATPSYGQTKVLITGFRVQPAVNLALGGECADVLATSLPANHAAAPKVAIAQELQLRGWTEPLTTPQLSTLARALHVPLFVRGAVLVTYPRARQRTARIEMGLELVDAGDESVLGGLAVVADAKLSGEASQQLEQVAAVARELLMKNGPRLARVTLPVGKVLLTDSTGDAHLNVGQREGLRKGMLLIVSRRLPDDATRQPRLHKVCEAVVRETSDFAAVARPTTRGVALQSLDVVTQKFELKATKELLVLLGE